MLIIYGTARGLELSVRMVRVRGRMWLIGANLGYIIHDSIGSRRDVRVGRLHRCSADADAILYAPPVE